MALGSASPPMIRREAAPISPVPPCLRLKTTAGRRSCWWPSDQARSTDHARLRSPMLRSTTAKVASGIGEHIFCSRRCARRPRAAACSRTAANTLQALARAIAFLSVSCKAAAVGTTGRRRLKMGCCRPCRRGRRQYATACSCRRCLDVIHAPVEDAIAVLLWRHGAGVVNDGINEGEVEDDGLASVGIP